MKQHAFAVCGSCTGSFGSTNERSTRWLVDRIKDAVLRGEAGIGKRRWVVCFQTERSRVDEEVGRVGERDLVRVVHAVGGHGDDLGLIV